MTGGGIVGIGKGKGEERRHNETESGQSKCLLGSLCSLVFSPSPSLLLPSPVAEGVQTPLQSPLRSFHKSMERRQMMGGGKK